MPPLPPLPPLLAGGAGGAGGAGQATFEAKTAAAFKGKMALRLERAKLKKEYEAKIEVRRRLPLRALVSAPSLCPCSAPGPSAAGPAGGNGGVLDG